MKCIWGLTVRLPTAALTLPDTARVSWKTAGRRRSFWSKPPIWRYESLIGPDCTDCFSVDRLTLCGGSAVLHAGAGVHIVSSGAGAVRCGDFAHALKKGDYFFLPACAAGEAIVEGELELLICRGGIEP